MGHGSILGAASTGPRSAQLHVYNIAIRECAKLVTLALGEDQPSDLLVQALAWKEALKLHQSRVQRDKIKTLNHRHLVLA